MGLVWGLDKITLGLGVQTGLVLNANILFFSGEKNKMEMRSFVYFHEFVYMFTCCQTPRETRALCGIKQLVDGVCEIFLRHRVWKSNVLCGPTAGLARVEE